MNLSVAETGGEILVVSQFTLYGDASKGRRPSFVEAARPDTAVPLYELLVSILGRGWNQSSNRELWRSHGGITRK